MLKMYEKNFSTLLNTVAVSNPVYTLIEIYPTFTSCLDTFLGMPYQSWIRYGITDHLLC